MLETTTVLELAEAIGPRLRCLVLLGGFAGMRTGELLGLQRRDIDPLHGTVTVERQVHELTGLGRVLTPPKSEAGRRTVALPAFALDALEDHLETTWPASWTPSSSPAQADSPCADTTCHTLGTTPAPQ